MSWRQKIAIRLLSQEAINTIYSEPKMILNRLRCFSPINLWKLFKIRKTHPLKLNIGAGMLQIPGWVNLDLQGVKNGIRWDVRWGLPFPDNSAHKAHLEHFLEHIEYNFPYEAIALLKECLRVLEVNGEFRVIVPDADKYIKAYATGDKIFFEKLRCLGGTRPHETEMEIINQTFRMGGSHRFAYDATTLMRLLRKAGFDQVELSSFLPNDYIDGSDEWRQVESFYVNAKKPDRPIKCCLMPKWEERSPVPLKTHRQAKT